jgi:phospholipid/cholesterol/gamma-HCH transport system substrate-binding protein/paraquat-inducible protein B
MPRKTTYFKVGLFTILSFLALVGAFLLFGISQSFSPLLECETFFNHSVHGLGNGSNVNFRGFKVGQVTSISLTRDIRNPDGQQMVKVTFNINPKLIMGNGNQELAYARDFLIAEMRSGLRIFFSFQGISGLTYLNLDYDDSLKPIDNGNKNTSDSDADLPHLTQNFADYADQDVLLIPSSQGSIMEYGESLTVILRNLREVNFAGLSKDLNSLVKNLEEISSRLNRETGGFTDELVGTLSEIKKAATEVSNLVSSASQTLNTFTNGSQLQELEQVIIDTRKTLARLDNILKIPQASLPTTLDNLRVMSENLKELSDMARRYPSQILLGSPPPREIHR